MKRLWVICIIAIIFASSCLKTALFAGTILDASVQQKVEEDLSKAGLMGFTVDINVRIDVPENENPYLEDAAYDSEEDQSLWGMVIKPKRVLTEGPQPTILMVTAYRRETMALMAAPMVTWGYNVVIVDMRGTGSSGGHWYSMAFVESYDVKYIIDRWIPEQSWSDGNVGMVGASYMGILQMLAAGLVDVDETGMPLHLKACVAHVPYSDVYADIACHGGNFDLEFMSFWIELTELLNVMPGLLFLGEDAMLPYNIVDGRTEALEEATEEWENSVQQFPEPLYDLIFEADNDTRNESLWQRSPMIFWPDKPEGGWDVGRFNEGARIFPEKLPVIITGGWFDIFTRGTLNQYAYGLKNQADEDKALIIGEWYHIDGAMCMGLSSIMDGSFYARWFNWKIRGEQDSFMKEFPVMLRVMGVDRWRAEKTWPLPESRVDHRSLYLSKGQGDIIEDDPFTNDSDNLIYDMKWDRSQCDFTSENPILKHAAINGSFHGINSRSTARWLMGIQALVAQVYRDFFEEDINESQFFEDERNDDWKIPTFTTAPLADDLEIVGPVTLRFWARTDFKDRSLISAAMQDSVVDMLIAVFGIDLSTGSVDRMLYDKDVQFVAELNDVYPDGRVRNITSGWLRASHRQRDLNESASATVHALDPDYTPHDPFYIGPDTDPELIKEGHLYEYAIELWPTCNVFKKGHRIRLTLTGSDFPHLMPVLTPSWNELVIDESREARLDFSTARSDNEGETWKWLTESSYGHYAFDRYLMEHVDETVSSGNDPETSDQNDSVTSAAGSSDDKTSGTSGSQDVAESGSSLTIPANSSTGCGTSAYASSGEASFPDIIGGLMSTLAMMMVPLLLMLVHRRVRVFH